MGEGIVELVSQFFCKAEAMNKILFLNGSLLIALMGFQQWIDCYWKAHNASPFNAQGVCIYTDLQVLVMNVRGFFEHLCPSGPAGEDYFYFLIISLAVPLLAGLNAKSLRIGKKELISLMVVNPLLYCAVGFLCQPSQGEHYWSWSQVAGPTIIGKQPANPTLVILP